MRGSVLLGLAVGCAPIRDPPSADGGLACPSAAGEAIWVTGETRHDVSPYFSGEGYFDPTILGLVEAGGGTLLLGPGEFQTTIDLSGLAGESAVIGCGPEQTALLNAEGSLYGEVVNGSAAGLRVSGFTVDALGDKDHNAFVVAERGPLWIHDVWLHNFERNGAFASADFGSRSVLLEDVEITGSGYGNAGFVDGAGYSLTVRRTTFADNVFDYAPIRCINGGEVTLESVHFEDNVGVREAGALWAEDCTVHVSDSTFHNNRSVRGAGALWMVGGALTLLGADFEANTAPEGSAAVVSDEAVYCEDVTFTDNAPADILTADGGDGCSPH